MSSRLGKGGSTRERSVHSKGGPFLAIEKAATVERHSIEAIAEGVVAFRQDDDFH